MSKLGWVLIIINVIAFLYFNHILFIDLIQRTTDTNDGFVNIFDEEFASSISRNIISIIISYLVTSSIGSYLGAKIKFKIKQPAR